jgi:hypothetical protein
MAEAQPASRSAVDDLPPPSARQVAAERAARQARADLDGAVDFLERVFIRASKTRYGASLTRWIDPAVTQPEYATARRAIISDVLQAGPENVPGVAEKEKYYAQQVARFVSALETAAREWARELIGAQAQRLFRLLVTVKPRVPEMHVAARAVRATVDATRTRTIRGRSYTESAFELPSMSGDEAREATGESPTGGTVRTRVRRMSYMHVLKSGPIAAQGAVPGAAQIDACKYLVTLMAHPRGVDIVDAFATSAEAGWALTSELLSDTQVAIAELQGDLVSDASLIWRFPPALSAGVARLGYRNRAGITQFALAWGASRKGKLDEALEIAGNCLFVLDLVGGPLGSAVSDVLNFVLAAIGTAVSFLRDIEQDQAATATAFAERSERLSRGSNKIGTVLQGLAAVATALAVPGAVSKITQRRTQQVVNLAETSGRAAVAREVADPRAIAPRGVGRDAVDAAERGVGDKAIQSSASRHTPDTYRTAGPPPRNTGAEVERWRPVDEADQLRSSRRSGSNPERAAGDVGGIPKAAAPRAGRPRLESSVPELPLLSRRVDSSNYSIDEVAAFYRANQGRYPAHIQEKIDALRLGKLDWESLKDIDRAIKQVHTDTANAMAGVTQGGRKPFIRSVKGTESSEGARFAKTMTDDKSLTLVGQYAGGTVEFDSVQFLEARIIEVKQSFRWRVGKAEQWVRPEEIMMQMRRQLQFMEEWGKWKELKWVIGDEQSYYLAVGILEKGVGGRRLEPELAAMIKLELVR